MLRNNSEVCACISLFVSKQKREYVSKICSKYICAQIISTVRSHQHLGKILGLHLNIDSKAENFVRNSALKLLKLCATLNESMLMYTIAPKSNEMHIGHLKVSNGIFKVAV